MYFSEPMSNDEDSDSDGSFDDDEDDPMINTVNGMYFSISQNFFEFFGMKNIYEKSDFTSFFLKKNS